MKMETILFKYIFILKKQNFKKHITDCTNYSIYEFDKLFVLTIGRKDLYFIENTLVKMF
jgi:hypothetical protein